MRKKEHTGKGPLNPTQASTKRNSWVSERALDWTSKASLLLSWFCHQLAFQSGQANYFSMEHETTYVRGLLCWSNKIIHEKCPAHHLTHSKYSSLPTFLESFLYKMTNSISTKSVGAGKGKQFKVFTCFETIAWLEISIKETSKLCTRMSIKGLLMEK